MPNPVCVHRGAARERPCGWRPWAVAWWLRVGVGCVVGLVSTPLAAAPEPIVVGILASQGNEARALAGARAYFGRINAGGGIHGRPVQIASASFDPQAPQRYAEALRRLIADERPVALFGCGDDETCTEAAQVAAEQRVPLVGPLSGLAQLSHTVNPFVFRLRAGYAREAVAVTRQLQQLACSVVALVTDGPAGREIDRVLMDALAREGIRVEVLALAGRTPAALQALVRRLGQGGFHAAVMNVRLETVQAIVNAGLSDDGQWPRILMTVSNGSVPAYAGHFKGRVVGFTQVVPNPELHTQALARELDDDAARHAGASAMTFEGMEGYIAARLLTEAFRRIGPRITPDRVAAQLAAGDTWNLGGFRIAFPKDRPGGSDWVDVGLRGRDGFLVR